VDQLKADIQRQARDNDDFRREVMTGPHSQVVLMSVEPGGEIGEEVHDDVDQVLVFIDGTGEAVLDTAAASNRGTSCSCPPAPGTTL
jgi:mannose-6-phosphate isomerase-like protein (cupin superfamily)